MPTHLGVSSKVSLAWRGFCIHIHSIARLSCYASEVLSVSTTARECCALRGNKLQRRFQPNAMHASRATQGKRSRITQRKLVACDAWKFAQRNVRDHFAMRAFGWKRPFMLGLTVHTECVRGRMESDTRLGPAKPWFLTSPAVSMYADSFRRLTLEFLRSRRVCNFVFEFDIILYT